MKLKEICLLGISAAVLAACGGGGGGSSPDTSATDTVKQKPEPALSKVVGAAATGTATYLTPQSSIPIKIEGGRIEIEREGSFNVLEVDGKKITLIPQDVRSGSIYREETNTTTKAVGANLEYARYGWYSAPLTDKSHKGYLFYQGHITPEANMPVSGTARYEGVALVSAVDRFTKDGDFFLKQGTSAFDVDFGAKTVKGNIRLSDNKYNHIPLQGDISPSGNQFGAITDNMRLEGAFFGPKANEMAGAFSYNPDFRKSLIGTFGAKQK